MIENSTLLMKCSPLEIFNIYSSVIYFILTISRTACTRGSIYIKAKRCWQINIFLSCIIRIFDYSRVFRCRAITARREARIFAQTLSNLDRGWKFTKAPLYILSVLFIYVNVRSFDGRSRKRHVYYMDTIKYRHNTLCKIFLVFIQPSALSCSRSKNHIKSLYSIYVSSMLKYTII